MLKYPLFGTKSKCYLGCKGGRGGRVKKEKQKKKSGESENERVGDTVMFSMSLLRSGTHSTAVPD